MRAVYFGILLFAISASARRGSGGGGHSGGYGGGHSGGYSGGHSGGYSGGSHSYPSSNGLSGTGYSGQTNSGTKSHSYPSSTGLSGNTVGGNQRNTQHNTYQQNSYHQKTEVHHHYHYNPPQHISYGSQSFPVYRSPPPIYVYEYRDSGSRFNTLLTGLALYNLGRMSSSSHYDTHREYRSRPNERCILGIKKPNGDYEETRIECKLMSSFIWEAESQPKQQQVVQNTITTTVNTGNNSVTTTVQNTKVTDALQDKGAPISITKGMYCFMKRIAPDSFIQKEVDCGLLQTYAQTSLHYNHAWCHIPPNFIWLLPFFLQIM